MCIVFRREDINEIEDVFDCLLLVVIPTFIAVVKTKGSEKQPLTLKRSRVATRQHKRSPAPSEAKK